MTKENDMELLQDSFLKALQAENLSTSLYLTNGIRLQGRVINFDDYVVMFKGESNMQMVYKRAIATIVPIHNIKI
jgi:host factor-I protein